MNSRVFLIAYFILDLNDKLRITSRRIPGLQLVLIAAFGAVDEPFVVCKMLQFRVCVFLNDSWCVILV